MCIDKVMPVYAAWSPRRLSIAGFRAMGSPKPPLGLMAPTDRVIALEAVAVFAAVLVGVGGFFGAIARYLVDRRFTAWTGGTLPWGTW